MRGSLQFKRVRRFLVAILLIGGAYFAPVSAALNDGTWQELNTSTEAINGTVPQADGAAIPVYQGSIVLSPAQAHEVAFTAMPHDFSVDDKSSALQVINPADTEGDLFAVAPLRWENQAPPVHLVWADAATPDTPLNPQPEANKSFCAQNMAGRHLIIWPQVDRPSDVQPTLYLQTLTGTPYSAAIPLVNQKIAIDITAAVSEPIAVSADHFDTTLNAAKVKAGENITLTVTTRDCHGEAVGNTAFTIMRGDALNRQGSVNNTAPVYVGNTVLTTTSTEYHGVTDINGNATVIVSQNNGPGVKTPLVVKPSGNDTLSATIAVIFTTMTSPDSTAANMWGHMPDNSTIKIDGESYTFTRPALAAESKAATQNVSANNEIWALFNWHDADDYCDVLPDVRQLAGLKLARGDLTTSIGWPVAGNNQYWSSSPGSLASHHLAVNMLNYNSINQEPDDLFSEVSCVDKASPALTPVLTLSLDNMDSGSNAAKVQVGQSISMKVSITDKATGKGLPYRYFDLYIGDEQNRKGQTNTQARAEGVAFGWEENPVSVGLESAGTPNHYHGITDANGNLSINLTQDRGAGVLTPLRVVLADGTEATANVIFTVLTSPNVAQARMWGHMQGVVEAGNIYKRPLLVGEAKSSTGVTVENHEEWATFNSVTAATSQCGKGQVPGQATLDALYNAHSANAMFTRFGWPTAGHSYISADTDGSQTIAVNLANGDDEKFTGSQASYLTCSGNELATQLDVKFNNDDSSHQASAKVGEDIIMTVHSVNALNGLVVPDAAFTVTMTHGKDRKGLVTGFTDPTDGALLINGVAFGPSQASMTYQGMTDEQGNASLVISQPQGVGLLTMLTIIPVNSLIANPISRSVTFTVPGSPDTPKANMWGHMADNITVGNLTFERPKLAGEVSSANTRLEDNETWALATHASAKDDPQSGGCTVNRLPRIDQLEQLYATNSAGKMHSILGWPVAEPYWSATAASSTTWKNMALNNGTTGVKGDGVLYTSCLTSDNPVASKITIVPVESGQWNESLNAAKLKKGETLRLKVTVTNAQGNPVPEAAFTLSRGDGYTRQGIKHLAGSGDSIVSPVIIDGESLNDTITKMGGLTGPDGSKIISITRPNTHGTKVAITAALYGNDSVSASIETIFTVVTSPDSDKAMMWGHMPETVTATDGTVFRRPLLSAELPNDAPGGSNTEDNETWSTADFHGISGLCGRDKVPSLANLQALYAAWPQGEINTRQGWAVEGRNYQNSTADLSRSAETRYVKSLDLNNNAITSQLWSEKLYFACLRDAQPVATRLTLTSSAYDNASGAAKTKTGETLPVVVTTLDAQGKPVGNVPVIFLRGDSVGRAYGNANKTPAADILLNHRESLSSGVSYYAATGEDGTLKLDINQDGGAGFKTPLQASIENVGNTTQTLPAIFTVLTSPDTEKANYWGHMPETVKDSEGTVYRRPMLSSEFKVMPSNVVKIPNGSYDIGETWGLITLNSAWAGTSGGCGQANLPTAANLQTLYQTYPDGMMRSTNGWPVSNSASSSQKWWAGDYILSDDGKSTLYAMVNLLSGGNIIATNNSYAVNMQTCLATPRRTPTSLTMTLTGPEDANGIAKAKKGEQIAATVTLKDAAGQPVSNALLKITRSSSTTRAGDIYATSVSDVTDDITLNDIHSSDALTTFSMDTSVKYVYLHTDAQGQVSFAIKQDQSAGLKTTMTATVVDNTRLTDSKDMIFTVITSPDSDKARMWGHMPETAINSAGITFRRPLLTAEMPVSVSSFIYNSEYWPLVTALNTQKAGMTGCDPAYQPLLKDLQTLYVDNFGTPGGLETNYGWPVGSDKSWWAVDRTASSGNYQFIDLRTGGSSSTASSGASNAQVCLKEPHAPLPTTIELTSGDYDTSAQVAKVKKGDMIPLTVTIKDDSGRPVPDIAFTIMRGNGTNRSGQVVTTDNKGNNDDFTLEALTPAAKTMALDSASSVFSGTTGADGTATFNLRQDRALGLKTTLTAKMTSFPNASSTMDVIFTVVTSPDTDKALYWGHMPETVTSSDGTTFRRPLMSTETAGEDKLFSASSGSESWAAFNRNGAGLASKSGCEVAWQPTVDELNTLYKTYPNDQLQTIYGWPVTASTAIWWWSSSITGSSYSIVNLSKGSVMAGTDSSSYGLLCLVEPHKSAGSITLTSTAMDNAKGAAVAAKGSTIPLTVTVKDTSGSPVADASFTLSRSDSTNRAGVVITDGDVEADMGADDLTLHALKPASSTSNMTTTASLFTGKTGADGTATFTLAQNKSLGLKTTLTATLTSDTQINASLDNIFMVPTSPDTNKAKYWGTMTDLISTNGVTLHRPLLLAELPAGVTPPLHVIMNREDWAMARINDPGTWDLASQCGSLQQAPSSEDLLALYQVVNTTGWPTTPSYTYLSKTRGSRYYCGVNQSNGGVNCYIDPAKTNGLAACVQ